MMLPMPNPFATAEEHALRTYLSILNWEEWEAERVIRCEELEQERDESRKWAGAQAVMILKLEAGNALLRKRVVVITALLDDHDIAIDAASLNCHPLGKEYFDRIMGIDTFVALLKERMELKEG